MFDGMDLGEGLWDTPPLTREQQRCYEALQKQTVIRAFPYYSTVKFLALAEGPVGGPYRYVIPKGYEVRAFSYGIRKPMLSAGFTQADGIATFAETNLINANETNKDEFVVIFGMSCIVEQGGIHAGAGDSESYGKRFADARLMAQISTNCSCSLNLGGDELWFRLGKTSNINAHGGLIGNGHDSLGTQKISGGRPYHGFFQNGLPLEDSYMKVPEGLVWRPKGAGADCNLNVLFYTERPIVVYSGGTEYNNRADEPAAVGVRGYNHPDVVMVIMTIYLRGMILGSRSKVA